AGASTATLDAEALAAVRRKHVGFIFQSYHLFPALTADENVRLALDVRGEPGRALPGKAREALESVGLAARMRHYPSELSGGEQQRVAIARAVAGNPGVSL